MFTEQEIKRVKKTYDKTEAQTCYHNNTKRIYILKEELSKMLNTLRSGNFATEDMKICFEARLKSKNLDLLALEKQNVLFVAASLI